MREPSNVEPNDIRTGAHLSNSVSNGEAARHRWFTIKEAFSASLLDEALDEHGITPDAVVLDPFSGSGTTAVAGAIRGIRCYSIEVNPFLEFVTRAKLTSASLADIQDATSLVQQAMRKGQPSPLEGFSTFSKKNGATKWLFNTPVLRAFEAGRIVADGLDPEPRKLVHLALLDAAMRCCNARADGKCLRYSKDWTLAKYGASDVIDAFTAKVDQIRTDLVSAPIPESSSVVIRGDARNVVWRASLPKFDVCVTSPPYANSFDYTDIYRPQLFLGQFVKDMSALRRLRNRTVRSHVQSSWNPPSHSQFGAHFATAMSLLLESQGNLWDARIPTMIQAYFEDMREILRGLYHRANKGATVWLVVATSAYAGIEVPVDDILGEIASRNGWVVDDVLVLRKLRSSGQHWHASAARGQTAPLRESIVKLTRRASA